jgi:mRNA-degrading endonuclease RelE of RelBE toxin-antitoxin system
LRRKFPKIEDDVNSIIDQLERDERPGVKVPNVGYDVYKVRLSNTSAGRGKRGGFRVVYYIQRQNSVILLTVYSKTQQDDITPEQIRRIIAEFDSSQT